MHFIAECKPRKVREKNPSTLLTKAEISKKTVVSLMLIPALY